MKLKKYLKRILLRSQKYTKTDMVYVARSGFWYAIGKIGLVILSFLTMAAFGWWLPKQTFGSYQYILSVTSILAIFTLPGMGDPLARAISRGKEGMLRASSLASLKWSFIGIGGCLAVAVWYLYHQNTFLGISFLFASFLFPLTRIFHYFSSFWQGKKRFDIRSKYTILSNALEALVLVPVIFLTNNLIIIIAAYFSSRTLFKGIFFKLTLDRTKNKEEDKETIPFGKHLTVMQAVSLLGSQLDKIVLWHLLGAVPVAVYSFSKLPLSKLEGLIPISQLALPKLSQKKTKKEKLFEKFLKLFLISVPLTIFLILSAPLVYRVLFPQYLESVPYFQVLALDTIFIPFLLLESSFLAEIKKKALYIVRTTTPFLQVGLILILTPLFGIWGLVSAFLLTQALKNGLIFYFFKKS